MNKEFYEQMLVAFEAMPKVDLITAEDWVVDFYAQCNKIVIEHLTPALLRDRN